MQRKAHDLVVKYKEMPLVEAILESDDVLMPLVDSMLEVRLVTDVSGNTHTFDPEQQKEYYQKASRWIKRKVDAEPGKYIILPCPHCGRDHYTIRVLA